MRRMNIEITKSTLNLHPISDLQVTPELLLNKLTRKNLLLLGQLALFYKKHRIIATSHRYWAEELNVHRDTIIRYFKNLRKLGLVDWIKLPKKRTNRYFVASWIFDKKIMYKIREIFPKISKYFKVEDVSYLRDKNGCSENQNTTHIIYKGNKSLIKNDSLLSNKLYFNNPVNTTDIQKQGICNLYKQPHHKTHESPQGSGFFTKKRGITMKPDAKVIELIQRKLAPMLNLTKAGKIKLLAFPIEVLRHGIYNFEHNAKKDKNSPFNLFYWLCKTACDKENRKINFSLVKKYQMQYGYTNETPVINAQVNRFKPSMTIGLTQKRTSDSNSQSVTMQLQKPVAPKQDTAVKSSTATTKSQKPVASKHDTIAKANVLQNLDPQVIHVRNVRQQDKSTLKTIQTNNRNTDSKTVSDDKIRDLATLRIELRKSLAKMSSNARSMAKVMADFFVKNRFAGELTAEVKEMITQEVQAYLCPEEPKVYASNSNESAEDLKRDHNLMPLHQDTRNVQNSPEFVRDSEVEKNIGRHEVFSNFKDKPKDSYVAIGDLLSGCLSKIGKMT